MCSYGSSCSSVHLQKKESVADQLCIVHNRLWGLLAYTLVEAGLQTAIHARFEPIDYS